MEDEIMTASAGNAQEDKAGETAAPGLVKGIEKHAGGTAPADLQGTNANPGTENTKGRQGQLDELFAKRAERAKRSVYESYGVKTKEELDGLVEKARLYDASKEKIEGYDRLSEELAMVGRGIAPERLDDVRYHFKGKGEAITDENLSNEIKTHPEWLGTDKAKVAKPAPETLGAPKGEGRPQDDEREIVMRWFGYGK